MFEVAKRLVKSCESYLDTLDYTCAYASFPLSLLARKGGTVHEYSKALLPSVVGTYLTPLSFVLWHLRLPDTFYIEIVREALIDISKTISCRSDVSINLVEFRSPINGKYQCIGFILGEDTFTSSKSVIKQNVEVYFGRYCQQFLNMRSQPDVDEYKNMIWLD